MVKWKDLFYGIFTSKVLDIGSNYENYIETLKLKYDKKDGSIEVEVRISDDGVYWSDWFNVTSSEYGKFTERNKITPFSKLQYRLFMKAGVESPVFQSFSLDLEGGYIVDNFGDLPCKPEIWLKKTGDDGDIKVINKTNGQEMIFKNIIENEVIYIDCENEDIETNRELTYRYNNHNNVFIQLEIGENELIGEGDFEMRMRFDYKLLAI